MTSSGDFFGGSQVALTDVLGDQNFLFTALSRCASSAATTGTYINLSTAPALRADRLRHARSFFYRDPYGLSQGFSAARAPSPPSATPGRHRSSPSTRSTSSSRLELSAGVAAGQRAATRTATRSSRRGSRRRRSGVPFFLNNGTLVPLIVAAGGGDHAVPRVRPAVRAAPIRWACSRSRSGIGGYLSRTTARGRRPQVLPPRPGTRASRRGCAASTPPATTPTSSTSAATWSCAAIRYLSFSGNQGFFANAGAPLPIIDLDDDADRHPGTGAGHAFCGIGGAHYKGELAVHVRRPASPGSPTSTTRSFGEPVTGYHLVDGRASYGFGLQFFFLGYPLHFDWSKLTDLKTSLDPCASTSGSGLISRRYDSGESRDIRPDSPTRSAESGSLHARCCLL